MGPRGIDAYGRQRHTGGRGPEPSQSGQKADPFHADPLWLSRGQADEAPEIIADGHPEECLVDPQHGLTMAHGHLHRGLEWRQRGFGVPPRLGERGSIRTGVALRSDHGGYASAPARAQPARGHVIAALAPHQRRRQGRQGVGTEPGGTGAGREPFNPLVVCANGAAPAGPGSPFDGGSAPGRRQDNGAGRRDVHHRPRATPAHRLHPQPDEPGERGLCTQPPVGDPHSLGGSGRRDVWPEG